MHSPMRGERWAGQLPRWVKPCSSAAQKNVYSNSCRQAAPQSHPQCESARPYALREKFLGSGKRPQSCPEELRLQQSVPPIRTTERRLLPEHAPGLPRRSKSSVRIRRSPDRARRQRRVRTRSSHGRPRPSDRSVPARLHPHPPRIARGGPTGPTPILTARKYHRRTVPAGCWTDFGTPINRLMPLRTRLPLWIWPRPALVFSIASFVSCKLSL